MHYYFPVTVAGRRLHTFHLEDTTLEKPQPLFSFIVKVQDNVTLFSVESENPQLISSEGSDSNVDLDNHCFHVERLSSETEADTPAYRISIKEGRKFGDPDDTCLLKAFGYMGGDEPEHRAVIKVDRSRVMADGHTLASPRIKVILSYEKDGRQYEDAVLIYLYTEDAQLVSAALDFGSEASQIRFGGNDENTSVIDTLLSFQASEASSSDVYWQGSPNDPLYRSVFFIHTHPRVTKYADKPQVGADDAFVLPLLSSSTEAKKYEPLELLPNLKLTEIGAGAVPFRTRQINLPAGSNIEAGETSRISDQRMRESILRLILSNFLHCMLQEIRGEKKYLRMVLMVPNVYYQSKIYRLVHDLYEDFATIQGGSDAYSACKGFEVQVVSESDAAFLGVRHNRRHLRNAENGHFLIIDAGKGTTDFSILQQHDCFENFSSIYRDGIPASGNALTYAFYEALRLFLDGYGISLNSLLRRAQRSELLFFMSHLERFKKNYKEGEEGAAPCTTPNANNLTNLTALNTYLYTESRAGRMIPNSDHFVAEKVSVLCKSLEASMNNYMNTKSIRFLQVLLTGRGFLFEPFKAAVIKMLQDKGWIDRNDPDAVIRINGNEAKTICLVGALAVERECTVNCNSGLIGSPIIGRTANEGGGRLGRRIRNMFGGNRRIGERSKAREIDIDFFYQGSESVSDRNITVVIGGREYNPRNPDCEEGRLFYTGDGFIFQKETSSDVIEERNFTFADDMLGSLVMQSLFPFYPGSIPADDDDTVTPGEWTRADADPEPEPELPDAGPQTPETPETPAVRPEKHDTGKEFNQWKK